jgi:hypothetical protein
MENERAFLRFQLDCKKEYPIKNAFPGAGNCIFLLDLQWNGERGSSPRTVSTTGD